MCFDFFFFFFWGGGGGGGHFFNASLLHTYIHTYIHGAPKGMRHWYSQYFKSHKHEMNEDTEKRQVDESIISLQKNVCTVPTGRET